MSAEATANQKAGKGFLYFAGLFVLGLAANVAGIYLGIRLGTALNKVLMSMGVSFGEYTWMLLPFFFAVAFWALAAAAVIGGSVSRVGQFMGGHMFVVALLAFTTIIGANLTMAYSAVSTFPGLEVKNSYVASQQFNERKAAQEALGWTVDASHENGVLSLSIVDAEGTPVQPAKLEAVMGRPTQVKDDLPLNFTFDGTSFVSPVQVDDGNWNIRMTAEAEDGTFFQQRLVLHVK